jgi:UDP-N-acetylglucosamine 2-epimerase (non-hydrolysing)
MVLTEHARRYLVNEGVKPETIIKTGSHMQEVLEYYMPKIRASNILENEDLKHNKYFLFSSHREENVDTPENLYDLLDTLNALVNEYQLPIVVSTHPRTKKRLEALGVKLENPLIRLVKPYGFIDYISLQMSAFCILSDSGTITEEASLLSLPAITIRNTHERPEGMDEGTLIMSGIKKESVLQAVKVVTSQHSYKERVFSMVNDYEGGSVSKKVVRIVFSYTDYINRTVWYRS